METRKIKRTEFLQRLGMKYGGLGIAAFLYVGFTEWTGLSLACPFRWLTGLQCPGCGATRMVTALLHGRWEAAWQANPLLLLAMPWILLLVGVEEYCRYQQCPEPRWFHIIGWLLVAAFLLFGFGRNIC